MLTNQTPKDGRVLLLPCFLRWLLTLLVQRLNPQQRMHMLSLMPFALSQLFQEGRMVDLSCVSCFMRVTRVDRHEQSLLYSPNRRYPVSWSSASRNANYLGADISRLGMRFSSIGAYLHSCLTLTVPCLLLRLGRRSILGYCNTQSYFVRCK